MSGRRSSGRRPGASTTREELIDAARQEFSEHGVTGATTRRIAARAGVDPGMIRHHFGSKAGLWQAALELPVEPGRFLAAARTAPHDEVARVMLATLLRGWDSPLGGAFRAVIRSAVQDPVYADRAREFLLARAIMPVVRRVAPEAQGAAADPAVLAERASLAASQVTGLVLARYILRIEPLASAEHDWILDRIAPTVQGYLTGPLAGAPDPRS
ncbi:TetR/AcrR family transcriptional regulator [Agromyces marinus]|uniref:TetR family transcriptional regulator n=1 Tax=Agromyces marinus TaxID=1389020 RepID=A0ABN6YAF5_9MICO|nr:TetR family transcriptional regulator [Agromyces marinus]UIP57535.1 HTH-type transcriptional regulator BetI [Agromyces marinus]BDZ54325.1 TetR family transcriptional regulator [Agromyces marinus]